MPLNCLLSPYLPKCQNLKSHGVIKSVNGGMTQWNGHQTRDKGGTQGSTQDLWLIQAYSIAFSQTMHFLPIIVATLHQASVSVPFFQWYFAYFMSPCHISVIPTVFQTVSSSLYL